VGTRRRTVLAAAMMTMALAVSRPLNGQTSENDEPVFDLGDGITPPKVTHQVNPKPDSGTKGFRITGQVLIALIVNSRGLPVNVHVLRSVDREIDASAVEAVRQWRFEPARRDGKPVAVRVTVEIRFHDL
jgi:periplasmic protein TonB